jgi:UDP-N-acetylmuramoyl-tripeptide--D-alanyl-D-alanine ligase
MKKFIRTFFAANLSYLARAVLRKYKPKIVMITGSVGKTSTKDAVAAVLREQFYVRASEKSYNSEFGVPLTILGSKNPWAHPTYWLRTFLSAWQMVIFPNHYPKLLVLEVGADSPGDLARILRIATPDVVVVTQLPHVPVHIEAYISADAVREEEFSPAYTLAPGSSLVLSCDDEYAAALARPLDVQIHTYGLSKKPDVLIVHEKVHFVDGVAVGMMCDFVIGKNSYPVVVHGVLGRPQLLAPAAAVACGMALGMSVADCLDGVAKYLPPPGRGRLIAGQNGSTLIDDSYNASPAAVEAALDSLNLLAGNMKMPRRIAVLGDMLELGRYSKEEHEKIGRSVAQKADVLVSVGPRAKSIAESARASGMSETQVYSFDTSAVTAAFLQTIVGEHDAVLIKGSQSIRTEKIVESLLGDRGDRAQLVRQDTEWRKR